MCDDCMGCSGEQDCCCCHTMFCCVPGVDPVYCQSTEKTSCCQIGCHCCQIGCQKPTVCCAMQQHCCCIVEQLSIPPDHEQPAFVACLFIVCYPGYGCCVKQGTILDRTHKRTGGDPSGKTQVSAGAQGGPSAVEMTR